MISKKYKNDLTKLDVID